jgi:putative flavoprotein involved in K+ transport
LDLRGLRERGVRVVGRLVGIEGAVAHFADDLVTTTAAADIKLASLLTRIDRLIHAQGLAAMARPEFEPHCLNFGDADQSIDLERHGIGTVLWATGFRRDYSWLHLPVLDRRGEIEHTGGITREPGLCVIGLHFLRRRNSSFIDGVGADAATLAEHLARFVGEPRHRRESSWCIGATA